MFEGGPSHQSAANIIYIYNDLYIYTYTYNQQWDTMGTMEANNGYFMRSTASQGQKPTMGTVSIPAKNDDELGDCLWKIGWISHYSLGFLWIPWFIESLLGISLSSWMLMSMGWFSREILQGNSNEFHGKISWKRCPWLDFPDTNPLGTCSHGTTRWCPQTIAKLVQITPITMVYRWYIELVNGIKNQLITLGAPPCSESLMKDPTKG